MPDEAVKQPESDGGKNEPAAPESGEKPGSFYDSVFSPSPGDSSPPAADQATAEVIESSESDQAGPPKADPPPTPETPTEPKEPPKQKPETFRVLLPSGGAIEVNSKEEKDALDRSINDNTEQNRKLNEVMRDNAELRKQPNATEEDRALAEAAAALEVQYARRDEAMKTLLMDNDAKGVSRMIDDMVAARTDEIVQQRLAESSLHDRMGALEKVTEVPARLADAALAVEGLGVDAAEVLRAADEILGRPAGTRAELFAGVQAVMAVSAVSTPAARSTPQADPPPAAANEPPPETPARKAASGGSFLPSTPQAPNVSRATKGPVSRKNMSSRHFLN